jgi:hypothetical protein
MKNLFSKNSLIMLALWILFGCLAYLAGARVTTNAFAWFGMFGTVLVMVLREYTGGLRQGSDIATAIWKGEFDKLNEIIRKG